MAMNELRTLVTGRGLVESPRWHGDRLYYSDWSAGEVIAVDLEGRGEVVARVKSLPLCTAWLPDGRLIVVSSQEGLLLRLEPDGSLITHANLGRPSWNDIEGPARTSSCSTSASATTRSSRIFECWRPFAPGYRRPSSSLRFGGLSTMPSDPTAVPACNGPVRPPPADASRASARGDARGHRRVASSRDDRPIYRHP